MWQDYIFYLHTFPWRSRVMIYILETLCLLSVVNSLTLEIEKDLQFNIQLDISPKDKRQMSENLRIIPKETDVKKIVIKKSNKPFKRDLMRVNKSLTIFRTNDRSSSSKEESEKDSSSYEHKITTVRSTQKRHKSTQRSKRLHTLLEIDYDSTTIKKKKKMRSEHRQQKSSHKPKSSERTSKRTKKRKIKSNFTDNLNYNEILSETLNQTNVLTDMINLYSNNSKLRNFREHSNENKESLRSFSFSEPWLKDFKSKYLSVFENIKKQIEHLRYIAETGVLDYGKNSKQPDGQRQFQQKISSQLSHMAQDNLNEKKIGSFEDLLKENFDLWQGSVHRVADDIKVDTFIKQIPDHYSQIFRTLEAKTTDKKLKQVLKNIATVYGHKFNEYLKDTSNHNIRSKSGVERLILNSIDVCNRIVTRLFQYTIKDKATNANVEKELKEKTKRELDRACTKFQICRTRNSFTAFVMDFLNILLSLDNEKFDRAFSMLSNVTKHTDFTRSLNGFLDEGIKKKMAAYDNVHLVYKRSAVAVIKNIFTKRNSPLIVYNDHNIEELNKTVAFLEIISLLDEKVPDRLDNIYEWNSMTTNFLKYEKSTEDDDLYYGIDWVMASFVKNINKVITDLDLPSWTKLVKNANVIFAHAEIDEKIE